VTKTLAPLRLALLATLRLVLEVLVGVEQLLAGRPNERLLALDAIERTVSILHGPSRGNEPQVVGPETRLLGFATNLLAAPLAGQRLLGSALVPGFQVEAMLLDVLDDVFLLNLPLEAAQGVLYGFALLEFDLGQNENTP
jgi:hypothetical protein